MTKLLYISVLAIFPLIACGQEVSVISGKGYEGAVFNSEYELYQVNPHPDSRFTPSKKEVDELESNLRNEIKAINVGRPNQGKHYGPIIHKNLNKYLRQYIGFITPEGHRVVYVNFLWNRLSFIQKIKGYSLSTDGWRDRWIQVSDGGSEYWQIKYNLTTGEFFDFYVNGIA